MTFLRISATALACALLAACATAPSPVASKDVPPTLLMISIDGLRADKLSEADTPNLMRLAREGVRSIGLRPS